MAQYDGSIRINTEIQTKQAQISLSTLENRIVKTSDKIASLRSKMDSLKDTKIPTQEYQNLQKELDKATQELEKMVAQDSKLSDIDAKIKSLSQSSAEYAAKMKEVAAQKIPTQEYADVQKQIDSTEKKLLALHDRQERFLATGGKEDSSAYKKMVYDAEILEKKLQYAEQAMKNLVVSGKAFTLGTDTEQYKNLSTKYEQINQELEKQKGIRSEIAQKQADAVQKTIELKAQINQLVEEGKAFTIGNPEQSAALEQQIEHEEATLDLMLEKRDLLQSKIQAQAEEEQRLAEIKENATVADQELVDLLERRRQLLEQIKELEKAGVTEGYQEYDTAFADLFDVQNQINGIRDMRDAAAEARSSYVGLGESVRNAFKTMAKGLVDIPTAAMKTAVNGLVSGFQKLGNVAKNVAVKSFHLLGTSIKGALSKAGSMISNMVSNLKKLGSTAKKSFGDVNKSAKKTSGTMGTIASRFKGLMLSFLLFNQISKALNGSVKAIKEGFENLYKDNERFQNSVDELKASVLTLKNAFAAVFRPLVDIAIPYIQMAADKMTELLNKVGQFTAAITGQKTYTKAIKQTADAFKDAKKAAEGYLSPLDEINKYSDGKSADEDENQFGLMFEELPIEQKFKDLADKVKNVFKDLFEPIKEAWNREGEFVIDSWKYGLGEVKKLLKDIGRDFLEVWKQPATIAMLQDILHIFGDIGLIVGNLANKFREAWNENNVGLHILENIRDIFAVIIKNIREAADYTVEWTKTLDFSPLLRGIERLTASLVPFFDFLSGTLADFYTEFLLPLASWTLSEAGIPRLLNVLADFMESINWEGLRDALKNLYGALEPYAEVVGTGLIDFIERMKEYGADFLNFLPEHINAAANALRNGDLKTAFEEFGTITGEAVRNAFNFIKETIQSINWGEIGTLIASFINGIDWKGVFESLFGSITTALNSAIDLIYNFITETDWGSIGAAFGENLSNAWKSINWAKLGQIVGEGIKSVFDFLLQTIDNIDWYEVGRKVGEFLSNIDWAGIINRALILLFTLPKIIWDTLSGTISAIDWGKLIRDIATALRDFFLNFDWMGFFESAGRYYATVMTAIFDIVDAVIEIGKNIVAGLKQGIENGFSGIAEWVKSHIFEPFMEGFRKSFQIHSPSKAMETIGQYIIEGLLNGLKNTWSSITSWIEDKVNWIIDKFKGVGEKIKGVFSGGSSDSGQSYSARSYSMSPLQTSYIPAPIAQTLKNAEIPGYATGQVIPTSMKKHLAYLGDNNHETEVVSPLSTIEQAVENVMEKIGVAGMSGGNMGGTPVNITLQVALDGSVVGQKMVDWGKIQQMATGVNPYGLGTT